MCVSCANQRPPPWLPRTEARGGQLVNGSVEIALRLCSRCVVRAAVMYRPILGPRVAQRSPLGCVGARCVVGVVVVFGPSLGAAVSHVFPATHTRPSEGCDVGRRADGARRGCVTRHDMGPSVVAIIGSFTVQYNVYHDALVRRLSQGLESR